MVVEGVVGVVVVGEAVEVVDWPSDVVVGEAVEVVDWPSQVVVVESPATVVVVVVAEQFELNSLSL